MNDIKSGLIPLLLLVCVALPTSAADEDYTAGDSFTDAVRSGGKGPKMVVIPEGRFVLGGGRAEKNDPRVVKIDYQIAFGATEITVGQYRQFLKASRSADLGKYAERDENLPVASVNWDEAEAYVTWLSRETEHRYRLPSASEWEYAARAGSLDLYNWGNELGENKANCLDCKSQYSGKPAPVGSFAPNPWGLYDMHGNVWEWTRDCIDSNSAPPNNGMPQLFGNCELRELRGGSAKADGWSIRADARASALRKTRQQDIGFRVVREFSE